MNDCRLPVNILVGMAIATVGLEMPVVAAPKPTPVLIAQVACVVSKQTPVFTNADPTDSEALPIRPLSVGTPVALVSPLPARPPARVQIYQPTQGFVDYAALNCGRNLPNSPQASVCRKVRSMLSPIYVYREPNWLAPPINRDAFVVADQPVYLVQTEGRVVSRPDENGGTWVEVDLQRTFGRNFGRSPSVGWLPNVNPNDPQNSALVYCN